MERLTEIQNSIRSIDVWENKKWNSIYLMPGKPDAPDEPLWEVSQVGGRSCVTGQLGRLQMGTS